MSIVAQFYHFCVFLSASSPSSCQPLKLSTIQNGKQWPKVANRTPQWPVVHQSGQVCVNSRANLGQGVWPNLWRVVNSWAVGQLPTLGQWSTRGQGASCQPWVSCQPLRMGSCQPLGTGQPLDSIIEIVIEVVIEVVIGLSDANLLPGQLQHQANVNI